MSKFLCHCGNIISTVAIPNPFEGELKWDMDVENEVDERTKDLQSFLAAQENVQDRDWIKNYFGDQYAESYPNGISVADAIEDIYSRAANKIRREVLRCAECERIYLQKEPSVDEWICYEKRIET